MRLAQPQRHRCLLFFAFVMRWLPGGVAAGISASGAGSDLGEDLDGNSGFQAFASALGRGYAGGGGAGDSNEYAMRLELFNRRAALVTAHNRQVGRTWTAGLNRLADYTDAELAALRGYRRTTTLPSPRASFLSMRSAVRAAGPVERKGSNISLAGNFSWRGVLGAMDQVKDQSLCGSCWAMAAAAVLRARAELYQADRTFSLQQLLLCTPNPRHCGGGGQCDGATPGLALEYAVEAGVVTEEAMRYDIRQPLAHCPVDLALNASSAGQGAEIRRGRAAGLDGVRRLAENKLDGLVDALLGGPVAVAVAAGDDWNMYESGVLSACKREAIVNHAVTLVGFGQEHNGLRYWHIMNSWGADWGEGGFLKLWRHDDAEEEGYCGWDTSPELGSGCDGGPPKVWVCGTCGILSDSVVPVMSPAKPGSLWAKHGGNASKIAAAQAALHPIVPHTNYLQELIRLRDESLARQRAR